jgi:hypothetical protein
VYKKKKWKYLDIRKTATATVLKISNTYLHVSLLSPYVHSLTLNNWTDSVSYMSRIIAENYFPEIFQYYHIALNLFECFKTLKERKDVALWQDRCCNTVMFFIKEGTLSQCTTHCLVKWFNVFRKMALLEAYQKLRLVYVVESFGKTNL